MDQIYNEMTALQNVQNSRFCTFIAKYNIRNILYKTYKFHTDRQRATQNTPKIREHEMIDYDFDR